MRNFRNGILCIISMCTFFLCSGCGTAEDLTASKNMSEEEYILNYSWDNSSMIVQTGNRVLVDDWDGDTKEDYLYLETEEIEGSDRIKKLSLELSKYDTIYILQDIDYTFIDIVASDFDMDKEEELLLLFDLKYVGANGVVGFQLLDCTEKEYVNVVEDYFYGETYQVVVSNEDQKGYFISNSEMESVFVESKKADNNAVGIVTGNYRIDVVSKGERYYIRTWQYIAGADMTDHIGDIVNVYKMEDDNLINISQDVKKVRNVEKINE